MLNDEIKTYLENLDREKKALASCHDEYVITNKIKNILEKDTNYEPTIEDNAERMALYFWEAYPNDWGTYPGPMSTLLNRQRQMVEYPDVEEVNEETLKCWAKRAKESRNPILSSRYEKAILLLAEYYANEKDESNLMRVLDVLEKSLKMNNHINLDALLKVHAYEKIYKIYQKYGDKGFSKAKAASERVLQEMRQLDLDWDKSPKAILVPTEIEQKDIDAIFGDKEQNELEVILTNIAIRFLPKKEVLEEQLKDISGKYPIQLLFKTQIISDDRMLIAELSTFEEDYDNYLWRYVLQYIRFISPFLARAIDELKNRISEQNITEYFRNSMLFKNGNKEHLEKAISMYRENDYLTFSHLSIPLIEKAIRELVKSREGNVYRTNSSDHLTLGPLLKGQGNIIEKVFSEMGQSMVFYFRLVLIEQLGMNLRNDFAHALGRKKFSTRDVSDQLFHIMICLVLVKKQEENNSGASANAGTNLVGVQSEGRSPERGD